MACFTPLTLGQVAILTLVEHQRAGRRIKSQAHHLADEDNVISSYMAGVYAAIEEPGHALQNG
jgi:hypothetical protein